MRRRTALGVALLFLAAGTPSRAMAAEADCVSGTLCVWDHTSYTGKMTILKPDECAEGPVGSAANKGIKQGDGLWLYEQPGCSGEYQIMRRNEARPELNSASARSKKIEY